MQIDYLGLEADWEEFKLHADKMALEVCSAGAPEIANYTNHMQVKDITKGSKVEGLEEYHTALRNTAIRGQTVLEAQRAVQNACSTYYRGIAQTAANTKRSAEVQAIAKDMQHKPIDGVTLQRELELHLVSLKRGLFVMFHRCLLSYIYRTTATTYPEDFRDLRSDMMTLKYSSKLGLFRDLWATQDENRGSAEKVPTTIQVNTEDHLGSVFDSDWKDTLLTQRIIRFHIPSDLLSVEDYWRLRIKGVDVNFHGAVPPTRYEQPGVASWKGDDKPHLVYHVEIGPHVMDRNSHGEVVKYWFPATGFTKSEGKGGWDDPDNEYVKPALFCHGQVSINKKSAIGWNLESVTGVRLDWEVQGIRMRV